MPDKWKRKYSGDERESQTYDETFRIKQVAPYGQDIANEQLVQIAVDNVGHVKTADSHSGLGIAAGEVAGTSFVHKFGAAPDFDVADGFVSVWDGADDGGIDEMQYNYSVTAAIDSLSSDSGSDTFDVEVQGLDTDYNLVVQTITLTGTTRVALTTDLIRVFRMKNVGAADNVGSIYCFENTADTTPANGVPDDTTKIRAVMQPGNNQTLMAIYTVPLGKTAYMRDWFGSTAGAKRDSQHSIEVRARKFGGVFQLKHLSNISVTGTSFIQLTYVEPEIFTAKTDIEMRMDTDTDIAGVSAGFDIVLVDD